MRQGQRQHLIAIARAALAVGSMLLVARSAHALDPRERFHDYVLDNWNIESGLPQISVLSITQDGTGYIWIGTQNGIARFDGNRFVTYNRHSSGVDTTMATVSFTDRAGHPWFGTPHGALHYADGKFNVLRAGAGSAAVQGIAESADGTLLFATTTGVMRLVQDRLESALLDGRSCSILRDGDAIWVGQVGSVTRISTQGRFKYELPAPATSACVTHLAAEAGAVWLGTTAGLYRLAQDRIEPAGLDPELNRTSVESLFLDRDGNLWIGTPALLFRRRPDGQLERIGADDFVRDSWVLAIFEDREDNLWLGSQTESLFRLWNGWMQRVSRRDGLADPFVWSVVRNPQGHIVLGTNSDVVEVGDHGVHQLVAGSALPQPAAYNLFYDSSGRLWIGTRGGVAIYTNGNIDTPAALAALNPYQINVVAQSEGTYWIGTSGGLYRFRDGALERLDTGIGRGESLARVRTIHVLGSDELLVGTEGGLRHVRGDAFDAPAWAAALEGRFVTYIAPIHDDLLGITTLDAGFGLRSRDHFALLTTEQGLPNDNGWTFHVVDDRLYVGGIEGVWRVPLAALPDPAQSPLPTLSIESVLSASGRGSQRSRCCNGGAAARSAVDGDGLWFTSISGALKLNTRAIAYSYQAPKVVVEGLRHGGRWYPADAPLTFDDKTRDVEINYTGLSFRAPNSLRFRYRLDGYDVDWLDAGSRHTAFYTNLQPGDYRFHVQAALPDGVTSESDSTLTFSLLPRWYERGLVRLALLLLAAGITALLFVLRLRRYRAAQRRLEALVQERTEALSRANERLRQANQVLALESQTDPLTGLNNRRFLLEQAAHVLPVLGSGKTMAFVLIDLDNFKDVNDRYGHAAGDDVLVQLARLLQHMARSGDYLLRWGGEEFLVLVQAVRADQALEAAERIRSIVAKHPFRLSDGNELHLTCSIGFALYPMPIAGRETIDWNTTFELADAALYRSKRHGRDRTTGLIAGPVEAPMNISTQGAAAIEHLVAIDALRWLHPSNARPTHAML